MLEHTIFTAERVFLRPFHENDQASVQRYMNDPALAGRRYAPWGFPKDLPLSTAQIEQIFNFVGFTYLPPIELEGKELVVKIWIGKRENYQFKEKKQRFAKI